jgi:curli biogenesis system outer membrane secretion channel CsgG
MVGVALEPSFKKRRYSVKRRIVSLGLLVAIFVAVQPALLAQDKPRIAVLEFENKAGVSWWNGTGAAAAQDIFVTQLVKSGKYRVLDRERLNSILAEQDFSVSGRIDAATAVKAGKVIGVKYFLVGSLTEWEHERQSGSTGRFLKRVRGSRNKFSAAMNARIIDAETGDILWADEARADASKINLTVSGVGGGSDYSRNTVSTLMKPMVEELTAKIVASSF